MRFLSYECRARLAAYLKKVEQDMGRRLTDSEVFGFAQINSEHCRHKIFGGQFIIDGEEKEASLFQMIKKTTAEHPYKILSAYKDNVAFTEGPKVEQFAPEDQTKRWRDSRPHGRRHRLVAYRRYSGLHDQLPAL